ncbi:MAG: ABC transporter permease [Bauldia sp.]|nr:ABC transporter permease [Bauldia sp.]
MASRADTGVSGPPPAPRQRGGFGRFNLEIRQHVSLLRQTVVLLAGLVIGLAATAIVLIAAGVGLGAIYDEFVVSIFSSSMSVSAVLVQAAPLLVVGLSAVVAFRVRFWNIGIEGQMIFGSIFATFIAIHDVGPESVRLPLMFVAAAIGGMLWIVVPALLKLRLGINEIISTLLLNYVAFNFLLYLLYGPWKDPKSAFPHSEQYEAFERLPLVGWENITWALPIALILAVAIWWLLNVSRFGFYARFVDANPKMAAAVGVPIVMLTLSSALLSGAISGVGGFVVSAGIEGRMTQSFFLGYTFSGILIAFLARSNALIAILVAVFVGVLFVAGQSLQVFYQIPGSMVQLIQAIIVISVAASEFFVRHRVHWVRGAG